jgi:hypothetical protein
MLHALLAQTNLTAQKATIVESFTSGRTGHSSEMSNVEANEMMMYLRSQNPKPTGAMPANKKKDANKKAADKMRKSIISMAWQMMWVLNGKCDIARINQWCIKYGYLKKPFNDYLYAELPALVTQFKAVYKSYLKDVSK